MNPQICHDNDYLIIEVETFLNYNCHAVSVKITYDRFGFAPMTDRIERLNDQSYDAG
jgi:hypothetical protein